MKDFNEHLVDAFSSGITVGTDLVFSRRLISGRARQAINLKRLHHYVVTDPASMLSDTTQLETVSLFEAGRATWGDDTFAAQAGLGTLFNQFSGAPIGHRNRSQIVDAWRSVWQVERQTGGRYDATDFYREFNQDYDLILPHLQLNMGLRAETSNQIAVEVFTRVEYRWVAVSVAEMASIMLNWGQDPQDVEREQFGLG